MVRFSASEFINHVIGITKYYEYVEEVVRSRNKKSVKIDYEKLTLSSEPLKYVSSLLNNSLELLDCGKLCITHQDRRENARDKVENPIVMLEFLETIGLKKLDDGQFIGDEGLYQRALNKYTALNEVGI